MAEQIHKQDETQLVVDNIPLIELIVPFKKYSFDPGAALM